MKSVLCLALFFFHSDLFDLGLIAKYSVSQTACQDFIVVTYNLLVVQNLFLLQQYWKRDCLNICSIKIEKFKMYWVIIPFYPLVTYFLAGNLCHLPCFSIKNWFASNLCCKGNYHNNIACTYHRSQMMKMTPIPTLTHLLSFAGGTRPGLSEWRKKKRKSSKLQMKKNS